MPFVQVTLWYIVYFGILMNNIVDAWISIWRCPILRILSYLKYQYARVYLSFVECYQAFSPTHRSRLKNVEQ